MKTMSESLARDGWQVVSIQGDMVELVRPWPPEPGIHPSWLMCPEENVATALELVDAPTIVEGDCHAER